MKKYIPILIILLSCTKEIEKPQIEEVLSSITTDVWDLGGDTISYNVPFGEVAITKGGTIKNGIIIVKGGGIAFYPSSDLTLENIKIFSTDPNGRGIEAVGNITCRNVSIEADQEGIRLNGPYCNLNFEGTIKSGGYGIMASSYTDFLNTVRVKGNITSTLNSAVAVYGATVDIQNSFLYGVNYFGLETGSGKITVTNTRLKSTGQSLDGFAYFDYSPNDGSFIKFDNVLFESSVYSIGGSGSYSARMPFYFLTKCYASAPVKVLGSGVAPYNFINPENLIIKKRLTVKGVKYW
jgi:hypothetical protein